MTELERKFQSERKQKEIELQQEQLKRQQAEIDIQAQISEKQRFQRNAFIIGFVLSIFIVILVFRSYLEKKRTSQILAKQKDEIEAQRDQLALMNNELTQKNDEISAQRDEIESQRDLLIIRKNQVEKIHKELTDSIQYAKRIQGAIMPTIEQLDEIFSEYFLMFRPRDIVSGDFYWASRRGSWIIFCVADCTGHGVPGAFMSMLGISFLNEIVKDAKITSTSQALDELRSLIIGSLRQKDSYKQENLLSSVKDGMDISLCALNTDTLELQFSGANNSCWIIKKNYEFAELASDNMPVAIHTVMPPFSDITIQLEKGDMVYLMSDGFQDQFGGKSGKKFMRKKLRELLSAHSGEECPEQLRILNHHFDEWNKGYPQIDDVTILGVRI
jgi:serine phosphatase RsbU (regulator of sigma subunit)